MAKRKKQVYQLRIDLKGAKPPIWRRFVVVSTVNLEEFHGIIQIVMGWMDCHLHQFIVGETYYGMPDPEFGLEGVYDEGKYKLDGLLQEEKDSLIYEYDFGDGWEHKIVLEKILPFDGKAALPRVIKAKGACPPEDVGGLWGYYNFLEAISDPAHPEHEDYKERVGDDFDPNAFDVEQVNGLLVKYFG